MFYVLCIIYKIRRKRSIIILEENRERWNLLDIDIDEVENLSRDLDVSPLVARVLIAHDIASGDRNVLQDFMEPPEELLYTTEGLTDPESLNKALQRLSDAISNKEKIIINGDPDADGISGTAILVAGLQHLGAKVSYLFPVRSREGHGLQVRIIDEAKRDGVTLIITTDCGSRDLEVVNYANDQGIDVIITDHHILGKNLPNAYAIVNPYLYEGDSLFKELSGAGVSYKFMLAFFQFMNKELPKFLLNFFLALATLGTLSDRMSMLNVLNRAIVSRGILAIDSTKREGLKALKRICLSKGQKVIRARELSRSIIPRLNAPGRIGDPEKGIPDSSIVVDLLLIGIGRENAKKAENVSAVFTKQVLSAKSDEEALVVASDVNDINEKRKYITNKIEEGIGSLIDQDKCLMDGRLIVIEGHNWNSGVIGIDTDRLKERFLKPAVILTKYDGNDYLRGSVRSIPRINMYKVLEAVSDIFYTKYGKLLFKMEVESSSGSRVVNAFGGHSQACGFSIHFEDKEIFLDLLKSEMDKVPLESFDYLYNILDKIPFSGISVNLLHDLDRLVPYGQNFEFPIFYLEGCLLSGGKPFGNKYQQSITPHVRFRVLENNPNTSKKTVRGFEAVGFGLYEKFCFMKSNSESSVYDVIFTIQSDMGRGRNSGNDRSRSSKFGAGILLNVSDIRPSVVSKGDGSFNLNY